MAFVKRTIEVTGVWKIPRRTEELPMPVRRLWYEIQVREESSFQGGSKPMTTAQRKRYLPKFGYIINLPEPDNKKFLLGNRGNTDLLNTSTAIQVLCESQYK